MNKKILIFILPLIVLILATIAQLFINNGFYNASLYASGIKDDHRDLKIPKPVLEGHKANNVIDGHKDTFWNGIDPHRTRDFIDISWDKPIRAEEIRVYFGENRYGTELKITTPIEEIKIKDHNSIYFSQKLQSAEIETISFKVEKTITEDKITRIDEIAVLARGSNIFSPFFLSLWGLIKQFWLVIVFYFLMSSILLLLGREYARKYNQSLFHNFLLGFLFGFIFLLFIIKNQSFENFVILDPYSLALFLGQLLVIFAILFWPGRAIAELLFRNLSGTIKNAVSFGISIFVMATLAVLSIKFDQAVFIPYILITLPILGLIFLANRKVLFDCFAERDIWKTFGLIVIFVVFYQFVVSQFYPFSYFETSYAMPYSVARIFYLNIDPLSERTVASLGGYQIYDRTPLLGLVQFSLIKLFDNLNPLIYVKLAILAPLFFLFPVYLWLKEVLTKNWIKILFVIIIINPFVLHFSIEQPNRFFAFYSLLVFYWFLIKPPKEIKPWQSSVIAGLFGGLAFLSHLYATAFIIVGFLYRIWQKPTKFLWGNVMIAGAVTALIGLPWVLWGKILHPEGTSLFVTLLQAVLPKNYHMGILREKWQTIAGFFVYYDNDQYQWKRFFTAAAYRYNLLQATTFSLSIFAWLAFFKLWKRHKKEIFFLFIFPVLILLFSLERGTVMRFFEGISHVQPLIAYLVVAAVWYLSKIKQKAIAHVVLGLYFIEHFYAIWFLQWDITEQCDICHPWHFASVESFWQLLPLIIIYALLINFVFRWIKNEDFNYSSNL